MPTIRLATVDDAEEVRGIYAPFCASDSHVSFEFEPPTIEEMAQRISQTLERWPWLVFDDSGAILGYVYAGLHSGRAAYQWSVNVSAYIAEGRRGSGIARGLYTSLFAILKLQGYVNAYAGATLPNPASVGLHSAMGFEPVGVYREVGFKAGKWHDTVWMQRALGERPSRPEPPLSLMEARVLPEWSAAIEAGLPLIRPSPDAP
jgi:L-amino acid N-acyltransferase YncA